MNDIVNMAQLGHKKIGIDGLVRRAQEEERRRIARDLHDSRRNIWSGSNSACAASGRRRSAIRSAPSSPIARSRSPPFQREIRTLSYLCHPPLLGTRDLGSVLEAMAQGVADRAGLAATIAIEAIGEIEAAMEVTLYHFTQEALANICRHAKASRSACASSGRADYVHLAMGDDGIGLDLAARLSRNPGSASPA